MLLTVVGCSGTFPGRDSCCSSYLVEEDGFRLVLDVGNGSIGSLQHHADVLDLDAVVLSHLHGDHCLDLVPYSYARRYHPLGRTPPLPVFGPAGTRERLCNAFESPPEEGLGDVYAFRSVRPGKIEVGPFAVEFFPVAHPVEAYAIRLEAAGRCLAYSGDTGPCIGLVDAAHDADLLLCEASWQDADGLPANLHLTARQAAAHADKAGVDRLLLTHLLPWLRPEVSVEQASAAFAGPLGLATTGATYEV
ncbi:MAG: MBL fold metallo-hydrolase [Frankiaceae bacterium]